MLAELNLTSAASDATNAATSFASTINWAQPSWDLFIILFFLVAGLLYGLSLGRDRIIVILISIYMALAVVNTAPYVGALNAAGGASSVVALRVSGFLVVFIVLFFLLSRSALLKTVASSDTPGRWWQVILFSILHVGLLVSITLSFLPPGAASKLASLTQKIFVTDLARFIWIVAPIVAMVLFKGGAGESKKYKYDL
jgi:hypothetical protein